MRLLIALAAISVAGCGQGQLTCSPAQIVRATVNGQGFVIPVDLKPSFSGPVAEHLALPSSVHRDDQGRWAYCQKPSDEPVVGDSFSFYPGAALPDAYFIIVGRERRFERPKPDQYPLHNESGFEVTITKGPKLIFSPAGGVRPTAIDGHCMPWSPGSSEYCRVTFTTLSGVPVSVDIIGEQSLSEWPAILARVDAYVLRLET